MHRKAEVSQYWSPVKEVALREQSMVTDLIKREKYSTNQSFGVPLGVV